ncbi:MAG: hypothetical protein HKN19_01650 [Halioglobus sp.]|nr:hypothetical protein [Halioglobus sp.]
MFTHNASRSRCLPTLGLLLLFSFNSQSAYANQALLEAAKAGDIANVQALLVSGADVNFTVPNKNPKWGHLVQTPLETASSAGHADVVAALVDAGAKARANPWYGFFAATWAGREGHTAVLEQLLVAFGSDKSQRDDLFGPALINAARNGKHEAVAFLLEQGISPNWHTPGDAFPRPAILEAPRAGQDEIFSALLAAGGDPTPYPEILALTAARGNVRLVDQLLTRGMDPNRSNEYGPALSMAACTITSPKSEGRERINATVTRLLQAGAKVNEPAHGRSPLFCAEQDKNEELIAMLQASGGKSFETVGKKMRRAGWQVLFGLGEH